MYCVWGGLLTRKVDGKVWKQVDQCFMATQMKLLECCRLEHAAGNDKYAKKLLEELDGLKSILEGLLPDLKKLATA